MGSSKPLIVGITSLTGHGSGKDYVADKLIEIMAGKYIRAAKVAFAGPLKSMATKLLGRVGIEVDREDKTKEIAPGVTYRDFLVALGEGARERIHPDAWIKAAAREIESIRKEREFFGYKPDSVIFIPDVRYNNEVKYIESTGGMLINVIRTDANDRHFCPDDKPDSYPTYLPTSTIHYINHSTKSHAPGREEKALKSLASRILKRLEP